MEFGRPLRQKKEKTLGWKLKILCIPGKLLGGDDTLSKYGMRHENRQAEETDTEVCKHLTGLLAEGSTDQIYTICVSRLGYTGRIAWQYYTEAWCSICIAIFSKASYTIRKLYQYCQT